MNAYIPAVAAVLFTAHTIEIIDPKPSDGHVPHTHFPFQQANPPGQVSFLTGGVLGQGNFVPLSKEEVR